MLAKDAHAGAVGVNFTHRWRSAQWEEYPFDLWRGRMHTENCEGF